MEYITFKRYRGKTFGGVVNIPALTILEAREGVLYYNNNVVCAIHSDVCNEYFANNDDGNGVHRGRLTQAIKKRLAVLPGDTVASRQQRWDKVWADELCAKYRDKKDPNYWLWDDSFYTAPIEDLQYIAHLIGAKEVK
jgi:hypothetical protein